MYVHLSTDNSLNGDLKTRSNKQLEQQRHFINQQNTSACACFESTKWSSASLSCTLHCRCNLYKSRLSVYRRLSVSHAS